MRLDSVVLWVVGVCSTIESCVAHTVKVMQVSGVE